MTARRRRWLLMLLLAGLSLFSAWVIYQWRTFTVMPLPLPQQDVLQVEHGTGMNRLADQLARRFNQPAVFWKLLYHLRNQGKPIRAGEYRLTPGDTPESVLGKLLSGRVVQHYFRIQEGSNLRQLLQALENDTRLQWDLDARGLEKLQQQLAPDRPSLEGLFFPDTYQFERGNKASALLLRAGKRMQQQLQHYWNQRDPQATRFIETPYDALILASIVEKETAVLEEMPRIAGVFYNRLAKNMRLQTDPTVIYGMGEAYDGDIRRKDLKAPTPWNTYVIHGLPPTPICMPGAAALQAVMQPEQHQWLYFVADGSGGHHFSSNYEQHRKAVRRFQLKR